MDVEPTYAAIFHGCAAHVPALFSCKPSAAPTVATIQIQEPAAAAVAGEFHVAGRRNVSGRAHLAQAVLAAVPALVALIVLKCDSVQNVVLKLVVANNAFVNLEMSSLNSLLCRLCYVVSY
ncbi:uncharacterized protein LOC109848269 [Asparagus officinalis]|uniref:uncharacterized protein LOC109848269 n=1 Tax=Asparagus officinalis TaxID=4686 RepID=UPI00098E4D56|nr:uncharacterized protein LOC109848269 [Asparagus officinalis]